MAKKTKTAEKSDSTATNGFEAKLWLTADRLRNNMDAAEYKHVVHGLIFFKYISDAFEEWDHSYESLGSAASPFRRAALSLWNQTYAFA